MPGTYLKFYCTSEQGPGSKDPNVSQCSIIFMFCILFDVKAGGIHSNHNA